MTEGSMDFQTDSTALPILEDNGLSGEVAEPPAMDLEEVAQTTSAFEQTNNIAHQLSSHLNMLSFLPPDLSTSSEETQSCSSVSGEASWHLQDHEEGLRPIVSQNNLRSCTNQTITAVLEFDAHQTSADTLHQEVYKNTSRVMEETPECDYSWKESQSVSSKMHGLSEQGRVSSGSDLMDLEEQSMGRKSPNTLKWSQEQPEDDHQHIQELLIQLSSQHLASCDDADSASDSVLPSEEGGTLGVHFGLETMEEKETQDIHNTPELFPECSPCPLHIATGRGLVVQERHGGLQAYHQRVPEIQSQHGLLFADADREDLLNLLRHQRVSTSEVGTGTPLARSEAVAGTSVEMCHDTSTPELECCGELEVATHHRSCQGSECCCTATGLERLVVGENQPWPERESAPEDSACMSPTSPDECPLTSRVRNLASCTPEDHHTQSNNDMVESVSFYPALKEVPGPCDPEDLLDGVIFGAKYLGSTQLTSEKNPSTSTRMRQAQEAVDRIKAPDGESQPMTEVDLFVSTQRIKVLTADNQEAMMDHPLQTISYIADIGSIVVLMARRKLPRRAEDTPGEKRLYKMICHVFHSSDAQVIAQAIGQAFSVAYQQFLHSSGIDPSKLTLDEFSNVLNQEELYNGDLVHFSKQENCKEIHIEKQKGEILGIAIVESGWGSILPTVVIANLMHGGPAEKSGELSIGDRIMSINGTSLVGLPLATCQNIIRDLKSLQHIALSIVHCPPVTTAIIRRPDSKHQLGFCVEDGIICSLMRGGIAERGGIRVGHRIIEINDQSVVATPHEKIIQTLMNAVGEVHIKTMPASTYRLLTGQEQPIYL
ncbi:amyloid-beta A4 precursor protein-binding family A member 3 [Pleurodeles waltl]